MKGIERIQILFDEIGRIVSEEFPEFTDANLYISNEGRKTIDITKWDAFENSDDIPNTKRRFLAQYSKSSDAKWTMDASEGENNYLDSIGKLLKGA